MHWKCHSELWRQDVDMKEASLESETLEGQNMPSLPSSEGKQRSSKAVEESSGMLASSKREGKWKRGRPAGGSSKKGKISVNQARRRRVWLGKKPSKICKNESDDSGSSEKAIKEDVEMSEGNENHGLVGIENLEIQQIEVVEDSESSCRGKATEQEVTGYVGQVGQSDTEIGEMYHGQDSEKPETLEVMVDAVQAMLLDMIPSLGTKKVETPMQSMKDEKPPAEPIAGHAK